MSGICLLVALEPTSRWPPMVAAAFCLLWPLLEWRLTVRPDCRLRQLPYAALYGGECLTTTALLSWAGLPPLAGAGVVVALLAGAAAQAGRRLLLTAAPALLVGALIGWSTAPVTITPAAPWADRAL